jgi:transcriptional regulator with XRE-family HTH domain
MADLTGLSKSMLSRVERGERELAPMTKVRVARRLGVRVSDLFTVEEISA